MDEKQAEIVDFAIIDQYGQYSSIIEKGSTCQVKAKLTFHSQVKNPIFTITIRNKQGTDITGTNTMFERVETGTVEAERQESSPIPSGLTCRVEIISFPLDVPDMWEMNLKCTTDSMIWWE